MSGGKVPSHLPRLDDAAETDDQKTTDDAIHVETQRQPVRMVDSLVEILIVGKSGESKDPQSPDDEMISGDGGIIGSKANTSGNIADREFVTGDVTQDA